MGGSAIGGGLVVMQSHQDYVLQLLADGEHDRARMQVSACYDDFSVFVRSILDRWDDDIEAAVEEAEENFEPDWSECPNCEDHQAELETRNEELDNVRDELDEARGERDEVQRELDEARAELVLAERSALAFLMAMARLLPAR